MLSQQPEFYVYLKFNLEGIPRYVGKGKGNRAWDHETTGSHNKEVQRLVEKARKIGREVPTVILAEGLIESEAFELEKLWIATIGRLDQKKGTLFNHTDGGDGASGIIFTDSRRKSIGKQAKLHMDNLWRDPAFQEKQRTPRGPMPDSTVTSLKIGAQRRRAREIKQGISRKHKPEACEKIRQAKLAYWAEYRLKKEAES